MFFFKDSHLKFLPLRICLKHLDSVAKWINDTWDDTQQIDLKKRKEILLTLKDKVFVASLSGVPVAVFALLNNANEADMPLPEYSVNHQHMPDSLYLDFVFVNPDFRGKGYADQIIKEAKFLAARFGAKYLHLETLTPMLTFFYSKHGAEFIRKGQMSQQTTDFLSFNLQSEAQLADNALLAMPENPQSPRP